MSAFYAGRGGGLAIFFLQAVPEPVQEKLLTADSNVGRALAQASSSPSTNICMWVFNPISDNQWEENTPGTSTGTAVKNTKMGLYYEYLGPKILTGFDSYKYSSKDTSPLSQYVMHPFWNQVCVAAELLYEKVMEQKYYSSYQI